MPSTKPTEVGRYRTRWRPGRQRCSGGHEGIGAVTISSTTPCAPSNSSAVAGAGLFQHPPACPARHPSRSPAARQAGLPDQSPRRRRGPDIVMRCQPCLRRASLHWPIARRRTARHLVLIGRTDAAAGGADLAGAADGFALLAQPDGPAGSARRCRRPPACRGDLRPLVAQQGDFLHQMRRVDDNATAITDSLPGRTMPDGSATACIRRRQ